MARLAALNLIEDVMGKGLPLQESIARSREYDALDARDRRFCRRIISLTLRHHGEASAILAPHLNRPPKGKNRKAGFVLMMAVTEMIMGGGEPHAVVDQSVRLVKAVELAHLGGLTNAVLRKIAAEAETLKARPADAWANLPTWLARAIRADWPDQADAVAASLMRRKTPMVWILPWLNPPRTIITSPLLPWWAPEPISSPIPAVMSRAMCPGESIGSNRRLKALIPPITGSVSLTGHSWITTTWWFAPGWS